MSMPSAEYIPPAAPPPLTAAQIAAQREAQRKQRLIIAAVVAVVVLLVAALATVIYFLLRPETPAEDVGRLRDIFIIVVALESLTIGVAMIVLIVQLASLINLLQNEIRPILQATTDTVNNLRGTAEFLGQNVVEPVIKLNGYLAGLNRMLELMGIKKK
jgi:formate hydrogenlyase subunit 3/multisubunit Na+/H+ antiporter MnhD subunit